MSEYIIEIPDEYFASYDTKRDMYYPDERDSAMQITPFVRCRDCKFCHKNYCEKRTSPTVSPSEIFWIPVEPDGFCAWGERRDGE